MSMSLLSVELREAGAGAQIHGSREVTDREHDVAIVNTVNGVLQIKDECFVAT